jgi:hypothetical protein
MRYILRREGECVYMTEALIDVAVLLSCELPVED